jgi:alpha-beta hydrolase superfamily lysophospholipase
MIFESSSIKFQDNITFHIKKWLPEAPAVGLIFLLHGLSDHSGRFRHLGEGFAKEGLIFFAPDLRGNGQSEGKRGHFSSYEQVMDDIEFLLLQAKEENPGIPVFLYGQSMGGNLALNYCIRRKPLISGVISSSPWLRLTKEPSAITRTIGSFMRHLMPALSIPNGLNADDLTHDPVISNAYRNDPLVHGRITLNTFNMISSSGEWALKNAAELKLPLLLLHGTADRITSFDASEQFAKKCNGNCNFIIKPGMYHELHNEQGKQELLKEIIAWTKNK